MRARTLVLGLATLVAACATAHAASPTPRVASVVAPAPLAAPALSPAGWTAPAFSRMDSLFLAAATGEPRFQALRDSSEKALVALGDSTLRYLAERRFSGQTPRQTHYVERLFTVISDSGRNPSPRLVLAKALESAPDTVRAQLLYVGSALGDTLFREVAIEWLNVSSVPLVRRMALRSLGLYRKPSDPAPLFATLPKTSGLERHQVLWALEKHAPLRDFGALVPYLGDSAFYNRRKVRDLLLKSADSSWAKLEPLFPAVMDKAVRREAWLLALEARDGEAFLRRNRALMTPAERIFFQVK